MALRAATILIITTCLSAAALFAFAGCRGGERRAAVAGSLLPAPAAPAAADLVEGTSLLGRPLIRPQLPPDVLAQREHQLEEAQHAYDNALHDEDAIIWLGRRLAYLGRYREAIDVFSNGLALDPESYRLLRHRGHRYITLRHFQEAVVDLERAALLIVGVPDEVEPDGQPNALNVPTSTSHTNIHYHLALAHYLRGDFAAAAEEWRACRHLAANDDMRVAASYWLFLSLQRLGREDQAATLLQSITPAMNVIENHSYHRLLLVYRGELDPAELTAGGDDVALDAATIGYGLGMRDLLHGDAEAAQRGFRRVIAESSWAAFGHLAAEAELARMQGATMPSNEERLTK